MNQHRRLVSLSGSGILGRVLKDSRQRQSSSGEAAQGHFMICKQAQEGEAAARSENCVQLALLLAADSGLSLCFFPGLFPAQHPESPFSH